ncbi:MAG: YbhB/YbcL family Raf kinase inhibitor-like protein [Candidatus Binataceae bacterium]
MHRRVPGAAIVLGLIALMGGAAAPEAGRAASLQLTSPAFSHNAEIPAKYTCDGQKISPPLQWSGVPADAKSLVLIVDDPDAPDPAAPQIVWVHWVLYDIPASANGLPEAVQTAQLPAGTRQGVGSPGNTTYRGPCPPIGRHRYFFKLYALDSALGDMGGATAAALQRAMKGHVLAATELIGTYQRER